jgi:hypothetical protein
LNRPIISSDKPSWIAAWRGTVRWQLVAFFSRLKDVLMGRTGTGPIESDQAPYFTVSLLKLAVMSICTLGIYELYWFYKNWNLIKQRERSDIMPFWRAIFAFFFCYQCFSRICEHAESLRLYRSAPAGLLAAGWIITTLLADLPDPYNFVSLLSFVFLLPVQALANRINATATPHHAPNRNFTAWNLLGIAIGIIMIGWAEIIGG